MPTARTSPPSAASSPACATPGAGTPSRWRCRPGARCPTFLPRRATTSATATSNAASPSSPGSTTPTKTALPKPAMAPQRQESPGSRSSESFAWLNSTNPKEGKPSREDGKPEEDPGSGGGEADLAAGGGEKVAGEGSYHGSSNLIAKGAAAAAAATAAAKVDLPWPQTGESGKLIAKSKGGEAEKESSDVQRLSSTVFASWPAWHGIAHALVGCAEQMARIFLSPARHRLMCHAHVMSTAIC